MVALALSGLFLAAAAGKLASPWAGRLTVRELFPQSARLVTDSIAGLITSLELVTGLGLIVSPARLSLPAAAATALLAFSFSGAYFLARRRPYKVACHCFGAFAKGTFSAFTVAVSGLLLAAAADIGWSRGTGVLASLPGYQFRLAALIPALAVLILGWRRRPGRAARLPRPALRPDRREHSLDR